MRDFLGFFWTTIVLSCRLRVDHASSPASSSFSLPTYENNFCREETKQMLKVMCLLLTLSHAMYTGDFVLATDGELIVRYYFEHRRQHSAVIAANWKQSEYQGLTCEFRLRRLCCYHCLPLEHSFFKDVSRWLFGLFPPAVASMRSFWVKMVYKMCLICSVFNKYNLV